MRQAQELERLASACIFPGFEGAAAPDWLRRRLADGLGGVVLYAWNVEDREQLAALTAALRAERPDLLVAIDEEGGDVTRLEAANGSSYPGNAALGAIDDIVLTEQVAAALATDLREVGVNLDLAPVADVNTNPLNPVIGIRSFGADAELVARHVAASVRGLQNAGVAACAKHFPGHGDTAQDSHLELPVVEALKEEALLPFRSAIEAGVQSIMTAHIVVRSIGEPPATMNSAILRDLLRRDLGYRGLVMSDALEMRAISDTVGVEAGAVRAIAAGADALCLGHDLFDESVVSVRDALVAAVQSGLLDEGRLVEAASRVEQTAQWTIGWSGHAGSDAIGRREVGRTAAQQALECVGVVSLSRRALVVELQTEPSMAAGRLSQGPGDWIRGVVGDADVIRLYDARVDGVLAEINGRQLVVVTRDAHRHEWERSAVEGLLAGSSDAVIVETGLPVWRPSSGSAYIATYGAARVNLEAAAERL